MGYKKDANGHLVRDLQKTKGKQQKSDEDSDGDDEDHEAPADKDVPGSTSQANQGSPGQEPSRTHLDQIELKVDQLAEDVRGLKLHHELFLHQFENISNTLDAQNQMLQRIWDSVSGPHNWSL